MSVNYLIITVDIYGGPLHGWHCAENFPFLHVTHSRILQGRYYYQLQLRQGGMVKLDNLSKVTERF